MKPAVLAACFLSFFGIFRLAPATEPETAQAIYDFELIDIDGKKTTLAEHRHKILLIVNVASECGATPQYSGLTELQKKYAAQGLVVLGFPSNEFGGQEPGSDEQIKKFCSAEYQVNFPMFAKLSVEGSGANPLFTHLTKAANRDFTGPIQWNFEKFLVDGNGMLLRRFRTGTEPGSSEIVEAVEAALATRTGLSGGGCEDC